MRPLTLALSFVVGLTACRSVNSANSPSPQGLAVSWEYGPDSVPDLVKQPLKKKQEDLQRTLTKKPSSQGYLDLLTMQRLTAQPMTTLVATAQKLFVVTEGRRIDPLIIAKAHLELAIAAAEADRFSLATFHLDQVKISPDKSLRAGAATVEGVMAMRESRTDVAARFWRQALDLVPEFKAPRLNLGFLYLRAGNAKAAKEFLGGVEDDWFAESGLIIAARMADQTEMADDLCEQVLKVAPNHGPSLLNCALQRFQAHSDLPGAEVLLGRAIASSQRPDLTEYAYLLRNKLRNTAGQDLRGLPVMPVQHQVPFLGLKL